MDRSNPRLQPTALTLLAEAASTFRALGAYEMGTLALANPSLARAISSISVPPSGLLRTEVTAPVAPSATLSDELLYDDATDPAKKYYLPQYRLAEETVSGNQQYKMALEPSGSDWTLTIYFEKHPAPAIEIAARTAQELPHQVSVVLRYKLMMGDAAAGIRELPFPDVGPEGSLLRAALKLSRLEERDQLYQALTDPVYGATLVLRRAWRTAIPLNAPDTGAFTVSSGSATIPAASTFDLDRGSDQAPDADIRWDNTGEARKVTPIQAGQIANMGAANFEAVTPAQIKGAAFAGQPLTGSTPLGANAVVIATPNWNPGGSGGTYEPHALGIWFTGRAWSVFNQDFVAMPVNAAFNILALQPGDGAFVHRAVAPVTAWSAWAALGAPAAGFKGAPATVSRNPTVCNVYVWGGDNALWQKPFGQGRWTDFVKHTDAVLASPPAAGTMGPDHEHVFVQGTDGQVFQKWWTSKTGWSKWVALGAPPVGFHGPPAVISRSPTVCNIYVWGKDNALWQRAYAGNQWGAWARHNDGVITSAPAAASQGPNHEEVFARGTDGHLWHKWWLAGSGWSRWAPMGAPPGGFQEGPSAVWRNPNAASVFVRGTDNALWESQFSPAAWQAWVRHAGSLSATPCAGSMNPNYQHVFVRGSDGHLWQQWWPGGSVGGNISGNSTFIDRPQTNGNPNANLCAISNWNPGGSGGVYNPHFIGVWYSGGKWGIFNQDMAAIPPGAAFNLHVAEPGSDAFVHRAIAANIQGHVTVIDHPTTNGNPNAVVIATANWNAQGAAGVYDNHATGVWYNGSHWTIFNQDMKPMPPGAAFNVQVFQPSPSAFVHRAVAANISAHTTVITPPGDPNSGLAKGTVFAVKTAAGNYTKVRVTDLSGDLKFDWVTYSDAPRYKEDTATLDDTGGRNPFVFPPNLYGYIFRDIGSAPTDKLGLVRRTVTWNSLPQVYFQDQARKNVFYYLPDAFKIARAPGTLRHPFISVDFSSPDGSLDQTTAVVEYFAAPFVDRRRLDAAAAGLQEFVPSQSGDPSLELLLSNQLKFKLGVIGADNAVTFTEHPEALVSLRDGISHSLSFTIQKFQTVFDALFSDTSALFQGQVLVTLGTDASQDVPPIPFVARMNDLAGDIFDYATAPDADAGSLSVTLRNAIESPVTIRALTASLKRGTQQVGARVDSFAPPADVAAGGTVTVKLTALSPLDGDAPWQPVFDLSGVDVKPDRDAIWASILKQTTQPEYAVSIRVQTVREVFDPPADHSVPQIGLILVELKIGDAQPVTVELAMDHLEDSAKLHRPLKDYVLGKAGDSSYSYRVTPVRGGSRPDNPQWKTGSQDLLLILSQDLS